MRSPRIHPDVGCTIRHLLAGTVIVLSPGSCSPGYVAPPVTAALAQDSRSTEARLRTGFEIHQIKCAKCHPFEDPADYDEVELRDDIMPVMARKAKLDKADQEDVLAYLLAVRKHPSPR